MTDRTPSLLVTGGAGRVGRLLRAAWEGQEPGGLRPVWLSRQAGPDCDFAWALGTEPPPRNLPRVPVILHLAGKTSGDETELDQNRIAAEAVCRLAQDQGSFVLFMSSAAVYAPAPLDLEETASPAPASPYGRAKLEAEDAARQHMGQDGRLTLLRLANLAGADVLFGNIRKGQPILLDPIVGQPGGPLRSYIGPITLARVIAVLIAQVLAGRGLPDVLNLAQPGMIAMADVLQACGAHWSFGPARAGAIPRVTLSTGRLQALVPVPQATAQGLVEELTGLNWGAR